MFLPQDHICQGKRRQEKPLRTNVDKVVLMLHTKNGDSPRLPLPGRASVHGVCSARTPFWGAEGHVAEHVQDSDTPLHAKSADFKVRGLGPTARLSE